MVDSALNLGIASYKYSSTMGFFSEEVRANGKTFHSVIFFYSKTGKDSSKMTYFAFKDQSFSHVYYFTKNRRNFSCAYVSFTLNKMLDEARKLF